MPSRLLEELVIRRLNPKADLQISLCPVPSSQAGAEAGAPTQRQAAAHSRMCVGAMGLLKTAQKQKAECHQVWLYRFMR